MKKDNKTLSVKIKYRLSEFLEISEDIFYNYPRMTLIGQNKAMLANYLSVVYFSSEIIRISTVLGNLKIEGMQLSIKELTKEALIIDGTVKSINYE